MTTQTPPNLSQFRISVEFINQALQIDSTANASLEFDQVITDSRKARPGCLFVAIPGDTFDGHEFIASAVSQGASGVLLRADYPVNLPSHVAAFRVKDTVASYRKLGLAWRSTFDMPIICVAGSVGKTTTKELLAAVLRGKWTDVLRTQGSQNGFVGIPMTLLEIRSHHGAAVIEIGIDDQNAMQSHMEMVQPTHGLITTIGPEHLEKLIDVPTVAREETISLRRIVEKGGSVALNLDDPWVEPLSREFPSDQWVGYSLGSRLEASPRVVTGTIDGAGEKLTVNGFGLERATFQLPLPGEHNARNLLAAITMARLLGLNAREITEGLETFKVAFGRSDIQTLNGIPVVCDYYNANPDSMRAGLSLLNQVATNKSSKRRIACLGDMLELGGGEEQFHRSLLIALLSNKVDVALLFGTRMKWLADECKQKGFSGEVRHFKSREELSRFLKSILKPTDAILIKGSRSMKMEEVWKSIQA